MKIRKLAILFIIFILVSSLSACSLLETPTGQAIKEEYNQDMLLLAKEIKGLNLQLINTDKVDNVKNIKEVTSAINKLSKKINSKTEYKIPEIVLAEETAFKIANGADFALKYAPLLFSYNEVIRTAEQVDESDITSVNEFSSAVMKLVAEVIILQFQVGEKVALIGLKYGEHYLNSVGLSMLSKDNIAAASKYLGGEGERIFKEKIIPWINNIESSS